MKGQNKMQVALNEHLNAELSSAYLYLAMVAYFEEANFKGMAHWMHLQSQEEMQHAMKIFYYIHDRRWQVEFTDIIAIKHQVWQSPREIFEVAFGHEQKTTQKIDLLMGVAIDLKDYAAQSFLRWFIDEQIEEEASLDNIIHKFNLIGDNRTLLLMIDSELGKRSVK